VPANRIAQQDPPAGSRVRSARSVRVWVSQGQRTATVPDVIGQTERTARIRLQQDGFDVGTISRIHSADYPADAVVSQDPPPDSKAARVSLLLNDGGEDAVLMPDLTGAEGKGTADALRERGFRVTLTEVAPTAGVPQGAIVSHTPAAGARVAPADSITLEVSR
jgi:serine/threonine-protein kinase